MSFESCKTTTSPVVAYLATEQTLRVCRGTVEDISVERKATFSTIFDLPPTLQTWLPGVEPVVGTVHTEKIPVVAYSSVGVEIPLYRDSYRDNHLVRFHACSITAYNLYRDHVIN